MTFQGKSATQTYKYDPTDMFFSKIHTKFFFKNSIDFIKNSTNLPKKLKKSPKKTSRKMLKNSMVRCFRTLPLRGGAGKKILEGLLVVMMTS